MPKANHSILWPYVDCADAGLSSNGLDTQLCVAAPIGVPTGMNVYVETILECLRPPPTTTVLP